VLAAASPERGPPHVGRDPGESILEGDGLQHVVAKGKKESQRFCKGHRAQALQALCCTGHRVCGIRQFCAKRCKRHCAVNYWSRQLFIRGPKKK
jgi:hypothetical protein